jgi:rhomboid protease GluP
METSARAPVVQFGASWRSTHGGLTLFFLAALAMMAFFGFTGVRGIAVLSWLGALLFAAFAWLVGRPLFTGRPILQIGPKGIRGVMLRGGTIRWADVQDVGSEVVQGHTIAVVTLMAGSASAAATRGWFGDRTPVRRIPLGGLRASDRQRALDTLQESFAAYGGSRAAAATQARAEAALAQAAFVQRLAELTPRTWALYLVVALNVGVWIANVASGVNLFKPSASDLFAWGANSAWAVTQEHQWWRLLTGTFLHAGLVHLAFNMVGLWDSGRLLNRLQGNGQFLLIYLGSALAGSGLSLHYAAQQSVGVGASGAVFGVLGALLVSVYRHRDQFPGGLGRSILTSQGVFAAYALVQGFARNNVDNAAHIGGLAAGVVIGSLLVGRIDAQRMPQARMRAAASLGLVAAALAALVATTPAAAVDHRRSFEAERAMPALFSRLQAAQEALQKDAKSVEAGRMTEPEFIAAVERRHLPAFRAVHGEMSRLTLAPGDPRTPVLNDFKQMPALAIQLLEVQQKSSKGELDQEAARAQSQAIELQMRQLTERMKARSAQQSKR